MSPQGHHPLVRFGMTDAVAQRFLGDGQGNVRIMGSMPVRGETAQRGRVIAHFYRQPNSSAWLPLGDYDSVTRRGPYPLAVDGSSVYWADNVSGTGASLQSGRRA